MDEELITEDEIQKIKATPINISKNNLNVVIPITLKSGYKVGYSIDEYTNGRKLEHISISGIGRKMCDHVEIDIIAKKLIGNECKSLGSYFNKKVFHYIKELT